MRRPTPYLAAGLALALLLDFLGVASVLSFRALAAPGQPLIKSIAVTDDAGVDRTGQQVDVNVGGTNPVYRLTTQIQETGGPGWTTLEWVEFRAWYKNGNAGAGFNSTPGPNYNLYLNYTNTTDVRGTFALKFPSSGEVMVVGASDAVVSNQAHLLTIRLRFGNQIHNASATGAWSWAYSIFAKDKNGRTDLATVDFGIFRFVTMVVAGSPQASDFDGTTVTLVPNEVITFSTNGAFFLEVSATDLTMTVGGVTYTIGRQTIQLNGGTGNGAPSLTSWAYYTATDPTLDVYGAYRDGAGPVAHPAYASGTSETAVVQVKVDIPTGTMEGAYTGSLTYRLWQQTVVRP